MARFILGSLLTIGMIIAVLYVSACIAIFAIMEGQDDGKEDS